MRKLIALGAWALTPGVKMARQAINTKVIEPQPKNRLLLIIVLLSFSKPPSRKKKLLTPLLAQK
jgi:hypothetical protein